MKPGYLNGHLCSFLVDKMRKKNHLNGLWKNTFGGKYGFFGGFDWYEVLLGARWAKGLLVAIPYLA